MSCPVETPIKLTKTRHITANCEDCSVRREEQHLPASTAINETR